MFSNCYQSHVAYPKNGPALFTGSSVGGDCPSTHPVKIPQIMLEVRLPTLQLLRKLLMPYRSYGTLQSSTTKQTGRPMAHSHLSSAREIIPASASMVTTSSAGRTTLCKRQWTKRRVAWELAAVALKPNSQTQEMLAGYRGVSKRMRMDG